MRSPPDLTNLWPLQGRIPPCRARPLAPRTHLKILVGQVLAGQRAALRRSWRPRRGSPEILRVATAGAGDGAAASAADRLGIPGDELWVAWKAVRGGASSLWGGTAQGLFRDFHICPREIPGTFRCASRVGPDSAERCKRAGQGRTSALDDAHREPAAGGLLVLDVHVPTGAP